MLIDKKSCTARISVKIHAGPQIIGVTKKINEVFKVVTIMINDAKRH